MATPPDRLRADRPADILNWRASDAPATRQNLRRRVIAVALSCLTGLVLLGSAGLVASTPSPSVASGRLRTEATITAVTTHVGGSTGPTAAIEFTYLDQAGTTHVGRLDPVRTSGPLVVGGQLTVDYDEQDPDVVTVVDHGGEHAAIPWFVPFGFGSVVIAVTVAAGVRLRWAMSVLRTNPWVLARSELVEMAVTAGRRRHVVRMLELRGAPDEVVSLTEPLSWRARTLDHMVPLAWVAGSDRRFVVAAPGGGGALRFRRVRLVHNAAADPRFTLLRSRLGRS